MDEQRKQTKSQMRSIAGHSASGRSANDDAFSPGDIRQTVGELIRIVLLRRWVFFVPFCMATTAAFVASQYIPRLYEAETVVEQAYDPVSVNLPPQLVTSEYSYFLSTLEQDIKSDDVVVPILENLGMTDDLPRNPDGTLTEESLQRQDALVKALGNRVDVKAYRKSAFRNVIELRYTGPEPEIMTDVLNMMKEGYKTLVRRRVTEKLVDARDWYAARAEEKRKVLDEVDARVTAIRIKHPGVDPANPESIALELSSLQAGLADLRRSNSRLESQISYRQDFLSRAESLASTEAEPAAPRSPNAAAVWLTNALEESETRVAELKIRRGMTDLHPEIKEEYKLQARYRQALAEQSQVQAEEQTAGKPAPNSDSIPYLASSTVPTLWLPAVAQVEMDLASLREQHELNEAEIAQFEQKIAQYVSMQGDVFAKRQEFGRLQEELERAREEHETYQALVDQCNRSLTVETEKRGILFTDIMPAEGKPVPISPLAKTVILLSLMAGLVTGAAFVVVAELFDRRIRTANQVARALGLPILETINEIATAAERRRAFVRRAVLIPATMVMLVGMLIASGGASYLSLNHPDSYERLMQVPRRVWADYEGARAEQPETNADTSA